MTGQQRSRRPDRQQPDQPLEKESLAWRGLKCIVLFTPLLAAITWSSIPALKAARGAWTFTTGLKQDFFYARESDPRFIKRTVQKHFLSNGVYIPLEDIFTDSRRQKNPTGEILFMRKKCGRGKIYVWVPFKINVPVYGQKVFEWCIRKT